MPVELRKTMLAGHALSSLGHVSVPWCFSIFFHSEVQQSLFRLFLYVYIKEHIRVYLLFIYIPRYVYTNVGGVLG